METKREYAFGEILTFSGFFDAAIQAIDHYSRWEALLDLERIVPWLANPLTPMVLVVIGLFLIHRSLQKKLAISVADSRNSQLRDENGNRIEPAITVPSIAPTVLVIMGAIVVAFCLLLYKMLTYSPMVSIPTPPVFVPIEKTKPWPPRSPTIPPLTQRSYGPNSPNVSNSHDLQFNYSSEPFNRILSSQEIEVFKKNISSAKPAPFWMIVETNYAQHPGREQFDEQGIFANQLAAILVSQGWTDVEDNCDRTTPEHPLPCPTPNPTFEYGAVVTHGIFVESPPEWMDSAKILCAEFNRRLFRNFTQRVDYYDAGMKHRVDLIIIEIGTS